MPANDPERTVPRIPVAADQTNDHVPVADDTNPRDADDSSADPNRTAARPPSEAPAADGTVARTPSDVARLEVSAQAKASEGVPGYVLLGELGRGGMGVVYKARHVKLNRVVALKMMLGGERVGRSDLIRFLAEAEVVAAVRHEHVVQVYDYGESDGRPFMALEFCSGGTLGKLLPKNREAATDPREMAALVAKVARGVAAAHALGIVHRDLKPANVFLDEGGAPKVADFGLAKRGDGSGVTQEGVGMGTPAYMAPEQARDAKFVGPQADVWALGVILYESLTGTRPFTAESPLELMLKIELDAPVPPQKVVTSVPRDLELICLKCLSKQPHERYPTAAELADDLGRYARSEPISVRSAGPLERGCKWVKRNQVVSGAAAAVFLALAIGLGFSVSFGIEARDQAEDAKNKKKAADDATLLAKTNEAIANQRGDDLTKLNKSLNEQIGKTDDAIAQMLLAPLRAEGRGRPLAAEEAVAVWQLSQFRGTGIGHRFFSTATVTPAASEQLTSRVEYALHAAIGLDLEQHAATERLFLVRLKQRPPHTLGLAELISYWEVCSSELAAESAEILLKALQSEPDPFARKRFALRLAAVTGRMDPAQGADVCARATDVLIAALNKERLGVGDRDLAQALAAVVGRLAPARAADVLLTALGQERQADARKEFAVGLAAVSGQMDPMQAADISARTANALLTVLDTKMDLSRSDRFYLALGLAAVVGRMDPARAADVSARAANILFAALSKGAARFVRRELASGLAVVAGRMDPVRAASTLFAALDEERDPSVGECLGEGLVAVVGRMDPARAADVMLIAISKEKRAYVRRYLALSLAAAAGQMESAQAAEVSARAVDLLLTAAEKELLSNARSELALGLAAVAARMDPVRAADASARAADLLLAELGKFTPDFVHWELAQALAAVAGRMDPVRAADASARAAAVLIAALDDKTDPSSHPHLAKSLAAVAGRMDPVRAADISARAAAVLIAMLGKADESDRAGLTEGLATAATGFPFPLRRCSQHASLLALGNSVPMHDIFRPLSLLHPHFYPQPRPLPPQTLVELLKHPFCVGGARRAVLDALELTYKRSFRDQWEFVEYAQKHQPQLDLLTPPKRLEVKP